MSRRCIPYFLAVLMSVAAAAPARSSEGDPCGAPPEMTDIAVKLTHVAERVRAHQPVTIVVIGGASTKGAAAGGPEFAYPHRMQVVLSKLFPDTVFKVVNKGVPRQTTQQMLERFPTDVFAEDPVLVIWETGISNAVRGLEIDDFATALQQGIDEVKGRAIDLMLVDMQFSHSTTAVIDFERYLRTIHRIGEVNDVYVFPRFALMRYWSEQNRFNFDATTAGERAGLAAKVYDCIGRRLGHEIQVAVQ
jgi:hypothetical protein